MVTIPPGVAEGMSFMVQCPAPVQAPPVGVAAPGINPQYAATARQTCGCCQCCAHDPWCCGKFGFIYIPAVVLCLIAIGCLAGGYNFDLHRFWNGCPSKEMG